MSPTHCHYCLKETVIPYYHQPCSDYMKSLMLAYDPVVRARGDYLMDVAMRHSTNRFLGRSDL